MFYRMFLDLSKPILVESQCQKRYRELKCRFHCYLHVASFAVGTFRYFKLLCDTEYI